jgi:cytochrome c oxidase subunit II
VEGFQPVMPTFQGLVTEEGVVQLIEYIKSLTPRPGQPQTAEPTVPSAEAPAAGFQPGNR